MPEVEILLLNFYLLWYVHDVCAKADMHGSEDNFAVLDLSFQLHVGSWDGTQV